MTYKIFLCFSVIVFVNVQCNEITKSSNVDLKRTKQYIDSDEIRKPTYNSNHPPFPEKQSSIPIAIVLDDNHDAVTESLKSSSFKPTNSEKLTSDMSAEVTSNVEKSDIKKVSNENSNGPYRIILNINNTDANDDASVRKRKSKDPVSNKEKESKENNPSRSPKNINDYEIPVQIVYETVEDHSNAKSEKQIKDDEKKRRNRVPAHRMRGNKGESTRSAQTQSVESDKNNTLNAELEVKINDTVKSQANHSEAENVKNLRKQEFKRRNGAGKTPVVPIVDSENFLSLRGAFHYKYEGGDGTKAYGQGELKTFDDERTGEAVVGGYSYKDKDGNQIELTYTADENGYRPMGAHLPTPPPIPPEIARALAHLATKTTPAPATRPDVEDTTPE
ncbi:Endocuticle structural glycoprotein SgAbd-3 [Eumeta japonica]|uniref:Endocuticle structural glycoprotein SgAbd-3 n=1 Tax=Eumeta variegata TaxID=151549 RepID=A0A4C1YHW3_EUMVA|nr:Endocuticle structural glycoprotein SgAbd-3 [Eumeta japonica]